MLLMAFGSSTVLKAQSYKQTNKEAAEYFSKASVLDSTLTITAKDKYTQADADKKRALISYMLDLTNANRAIVETDNSTWLWIDYNGTLRPYEMNTAQSLINNYNYAQVDRLGDNKWFLSFGGEFSYSGDMYISYNGRVGTYLWKRFLDLGLGLNLGTNMPEDSDLDADFNMSVNLTSRLYFTRFFSKWPVSPFAGIGIGYTICPDSNFEPLGTVGFNWYLSKGSIDFSLQYGKTSEFGFTAGYTISF